MIKKLFLISATAAEWIEDVQELCSQRDLGPIFATYCVAWSNLVKFSELQCICLQNKSNIALP